MTGYLVGKRTIEPAPDITTPDGALIDARNILTRARELSVEGPEAVWLLLHHAAQRAEAEIARQLRDQPSDFRPAITHTGRIDAESLARFGPPAMTQAEAEAWADAGQQEVANATARREAAAELDSRVSGIAPTQLEAQHPTDCGCRECILNSWRMKKGSGESYEPVTRVRFEGE